MKNNRKMWNEQQKALRSSLAHPEEHDKTIELFLAQHAMLHSSEMSGMGLWSLEDEIWQGLDEVPSRFIPRKFDHSIVWCFWHLSRCEDITMNLLVAGRPQLLLLDGWFKRMQVKERDTGNAMDAGEMADFSARINIPALRAYRMAVGRRTRQIVRVLQPEEFKRKTDPVHLQEVLKEGAVLASEQWLIDYWGGLTVAGLLLMPPTRHNLVHLNEAMKIKQEIVKDKGDLCQA
jgi:hypothetical protein